MQPVARPIPTTWTRDLRAGRIPIGALGILLGLALGLLAGCAPEEAAVETPAPLDPALVQQFRAGVAAGYGALEADSLEAAVAHFDRLAEELPDSPLPLYHRACAYGRRGELEPCLEALRKSVALGFSDLEQAEHDTDLALAREAPDWEDLAAAMRDQAARQQEALAAMLRTLPAAEARVFPSLDSLRTYYRQEQRQAGGARWLYPTPLAAKWRVDLISHELAALERMRAGLPAGASAYRVDLAALETLTTLAGMGERPWKLGREWLEQQADRVLADYPDSLGASTAALWQARAAWYGAQEETVAATPLEVRERAVEGLRAVASRYPQTPAGCQALAEALVLTDEASGRDRASVMPLLEELEAGCPMTREYLGPYGYEIQELRLVLRGAPDFTTTDMDGRTWQLAELRGRVVLIDFWATWCGPCLAEIPRLVRLTEQYPSERFLILGVSLDQGDRIEEDALRAWLERRGMTWPQVFDGEGWQTELARLYQVPAIPFPVLIGLDGAVLAAGASARGEALEGTLAEVLGQ